MVVELGDFVGVPVGKGLGKSFSLCEDSGPAQAGLLAFEIQHFKKQAVVLNRNSPFFVVIFLVERFFGRPLAASFHGVFFNYLRICFFVFISLGIIIYFLYIVRDFYFIKKFIMLKKFRFLAGFLSLSLLVVFAFAACGETGDEMNSEGQDQTTEDEMSDETSMEDETRDSNEVANDEMTGDGEMVETKDLPGVTPLSTLFGGDLVDVTGGEASGALFGNFTPKEAEVLDHDIYYFAATFENLPELEEGFFYEGWIVRENTAENGENNASVLSTGVAEFNDEGFLINDFEAEEDLTDHDFYVLTLEPDDGDPAPAKHILEGDLEIYQQ